MAVNKRKVLDAARKFAQKGAKEKALKEYHVLLKLDPKDAKLHLEIGDAYRRWGQLDEAIAQYSRVADQYQREGFDARAVAVFKQILNLDPKRYETYVSLSELYQHMGLDSEAIGALQSAADGYHKEGQRREALELLRRMAALDPTNTTSRMKVADLLRQEGLKVEAVAEYDGVAAELLRSGAIDSLAVVYERILEVDPDRVDVLVSIARNLIELKNPERAEPFARRALEKEPEAPAHYELLGDVYKALGRVDDLIDVTRSLAKLHRERGDEERAREVIQRLPAGEALGDEAQPEIPSAPALDTDSGAESVFASEQPSDLRADDHDDDFEMSDDELLDDDEFFESPADVVAFDLDEEADQPAVESQPEVADDSDALDLPEGDPDQLLAEASVYLRYGKTDQAIASLRAVVTRHPGHRAALEKLGEAYAESGDVAAAVSVWTTAAGRAGEADDLTAMRILRDRIAALDPAAAAGISIPSDSQTPAVDAAGSAAELELDLELELEAPAEEPEQGDASASEGASADDAGIDLEIDADDFGEPLAADQDVEFDVEVDFGSDELDAPAGEELDSSLAEADASSTEAAGGPDGVEIELDDDGLGFDIDQEEISASDEHPSVAPTEPDEAPSLSSSMASQQVTEDLEEGEFYFQQGLYDDAEVIYKRILAIAPNHPSALLRVGEIAQARGEDPAAATSPSVDETQAESSQSLEQPDQLDAADESSSLEIDVDVSDERSDLGDAEELNTSSIDLELDSTEPVAFDTDDVDLAENDSTAETEEVVAVDFDTDVASVDSPEVCDDAEEESTQEGLEVEVEAEASQRSEVSEDQTLPMRESEDAEDEEGGVFDLAAELREELEEEDAREAGAESTNGGTTADVGFESIFSDFKKGVSETLNDGDFETRYDLGIAYREMELYDDAIAEFSRCLASEDRRLDSLCLMALCAIDLNRGQDAVAHLEQALALPDVPDAQRTGIRFDLGRAFECMGDLQRARETFESVAAADPGFPGVAAALAALDEPAEADSAGEVEFEDRGESFDDLIAEAEAEDEQPEEVFESFDDLVTEDPDLEEPAAAHEPPDEPEPVVKKPARRKKISFV